jgi:hypothetical protein
VICFNVVCKIQFKKVDNRAHLSNAGGGDNGYGSGIVTSLRTFDRETQKEYYLPIIMKDSGQPPLSGTNTLTIVIGDVNDNKHNPGHKDIFVYNYRGQSTFGLFVCLFVCKGETRGGTKRPATAVAMQCIEKSIG